MRQWMMRPCDKGSTKKWIQEIFPITHTREDITSIFQLAYVAVLGTVMTCALDQLEQHVFARADGGVVVSQPFHAPGNGMTREVQTWHKVMVSWAYLQAGRASPDL